MSTDYSRRDASGRPVSDAEYDTNTTPVYASETPRHDVIAREKERFGGMKFGSAFFGWLTAIGTVVVLTAIVSATGAALGIGTGTTVEEAADAAAEDPAAFSVAGAIAIAVVLFVAYLAGGYVAGRMARFSGALQGLAVWLWGIIIAILVAIITLVAGTQWDILATLDGFPRIPVTADALTTTGIVTAIVAAAITLGGAVLGGIAGMRYHRMVDRVGLGTDTVER